MELGSSDDVLCQVFLPERWSRWAETILGLRYASCCAGIPAISSSGIVQPPIAPVAALQPAPPPPAPRKAVELVLVQNPGDDVCFAKHDEPGPDSLSRPQPASR